MTLARQDVGTALPAPVDEATLRRAEARLGFRIPPLLSTVYREVADGGFGPDYQLLPLVDGGASDTVVGEYLGKRQAGAGSEWAWPEGVLPILDWGCAMIACVDCRSTNETVLLFEPNAGPDHAWYVDSPSLADWLWHYVDNTGWWVKAEEGEDVDDMSPWPHAQERA